MSLTLLHVVGARPNLPKLAPVFRAARERGLKQLIVHTGQHYDDALSGSFFRELQIDAPDVELSVGSATHAVQTARVMERFEPVVTAARPDWVVVYGDVNSTVAASLVCAKLGIRIVHVEAGLRSFDRTMPEEINRIVTDRLADLLLTPSRDATEQLLREGESAEKIRFVGNVMIDTVLWAANLPSEDRPEGESLRDAVLVTLHRPSNVDNPERLRRIVEVLDEIATREQVVFPAHPRTVERLRSGGLVPRRVRITEPLGYGTMLHAMKGAKAVITDSGGVQEETTALKVPCFTLRQNTERPITVTEGTNRLVSEPEELLLMDFDPARAKRGKIPEGWDGKAGERAVAAILEASEEP